MAGGAQARVCEHLTARLSGSSAIACDAVTAWR
jgi:hypothetical protein